MGPAHNYEPVKDDEATDDTPFLGTQELKNIQYTTSPAWWKLLLSHLLAAVVGAGVMFFVARATSTSHSTTNSATALAAATPTTITSTVFVTPTPSVEVVETGVETTNPLAGKILDCGGNPQEAREKGCVYDVMMQDWVPLPCYDEVLTEKYLAEGNWTWYMDGDGKTTLPLEDMRKGEHGSAWMATSYHKAHCVFSWLKIVRALRNDRGISQELLSYDHVLHCAHGALRENSEDQGLGVRAPTNYARCALYDTWQRDLIPDKHDSTSK
ncbi:hypothetical protein LTR84_003269 [Exophiala bonariae]|uniref:Major facilitator superfamily transporter n=1 Tax=Exophiala bonariae TaxID=1690606 RepID=A0AAV9NAN0_9EURO|nr:hypothetical protein LTR84_003269 [Exophiala bonariae]